MRNVRTKVPTLYGFHQYVNGRRDDGMYPSIEYVPCIDLTIKTWMRDGLRHRDNGPAIEMSDGHKEWWLNGEFQRRERSKAFLEWTAKDNWNKRIRVTQHSEVYLAEREYNLRKFLINLKRKVKMKWASVLASVKM